MKATLTLAQVELRLMTREWAAMVFAFAFPPLLMLILAGVFGTEATAEWGGVTPAAYYVADYVAVPLGALALIGLPVVVATYRERGVLRRFAAAGVGAGRVVLAQALVTAVLVVLGSVLVLAVAAAVYGVPAVERPAGVAAGYLLGMACMLSVGAVIGLTARTARSAQALGLLAFFPMWLLGAGGPPRPAMPEAMARISDLLPLSHVSRAVREAWLGTGGTMDNLLVLLLWTAGSLVVVAVPAVPARRRALAEYR